MTSQSFEREHTQRKAITTDIQAKNLKPKTQSYKNAVGKGLYLEVYPITEKCPKGSKKWRFQYRFKRKQKRLSLGGYPDVSLQEAVRMRDEMRGLLYSDKIDPAEKRKIDKQAEKIKEANTFKSVALDWHDKKNRHLSERYKQKILNNFEFNVFSDLGKIPIADITRDHVLGMLRKIEAKNAYEMTHRTLTKCNQVFEYARHLGIVKENSCVGLREVLIPVVERHFNAITESDEIAKLLRLIDEYQEGTPIVRCALKLLPLIFLRTFELRHLEWIDIKWDEKLIDIPAHKMKMKKPHVVPLCPQALSILNELQLFTGSEKFIFPNAWNRDKAMSENAILNVLYRWGYKGIMTGHGFRTVACTHLQKLGFSPDIIDLQLAHERRRSKSWKAYDRCDFLPERTQMMIAWGQWLESQRTQKNN